MNKHEPLTRKTVDKLVDAIEEASRGKFTLPDTHSKNVYMKCCWLVYVYNRMIQTPGLVPKDVAVFEELRRRVLDDMPRLKEITERTANASR